MTAFRLLPLAVHAALRGLTGLALMVVPLVAGLSAAAIVLGVVLGAVVVGVCLRAVDGDASGRPAVRPADLHAFDYATAFVVLGSAVALAVLDADAAGGAAFAAAGIVMVAGNLLTRYSARG